MDVLRRRAAALARVVRDDTAGETLPAVVFELVDERYAVDARVVLQVHVLSELTPLAGAAAPLFGITHWRGSVLTILDLREQLGVRARGLTDLSRVIVIDGGRQPFGILADAARDFIDLDESSIRPLSADDAARGSLLRGITDDAVLVLDTDALLGVGRTAVNRDDQRDTGRVK
jgi:purine-binding chemotaxis protein CheW